MQIVVYGLNHRTAPIELREKVAFLPDEVRTALAQLRERESTPEAVLLSTCNRTEFYAVSRDVDDTLAGQVDLVRTTKSINLDPESTYIYRHEECVEHLFRVAGGIDSMVIGENGILAQVKTAFETAADNEAVGSILSRLFTYALRVGKRSRAETQIGQGAVSLAKAGVQLTGKVFGDLSKLSALVVGSGTTGDLTADLLHEGGLRDLVFANRTLANAEKLVERHGGRACGLDEIPGALREADVVVTAVNATEPVLTGDAVKKAIEQRRRGPLLIVDLGVPRNVDPGLSKLGEVFLYAVDDLQELVKINVDRREAEIPAVEKIVLQEKERFFEWMGSLETAPVVVALREEADRLRKEVLARAQRNLSSREREVLERFSIGFMNKLLHSPTVSVRGCDPATHEGLTQLLWTRRIFGLDDDPSRNGVEGEE
jgi:glutamyl-tRNA reductase